MIMDNKLCKKCNTHNVKYGMCKQRVEKVTGILVLGKYPRFVLFSQVGLRPYKSLIVNKIP
jgi:hypothetical protein